MSKSVMNASRKFATVPTANIDRSTFDRSHGAKWTQDCDYLIPFFLDEVLPGDTMKMKAQLFGRLATPINPIMDRCTLKSYFFFVPNRLVWENWKRFMGEQDNPADSIDYTIPTFTNKTVGLGQIGDYFGLPLSATGYDFSAIPFRMYNLIWNEWFRDQNLQDSRDLDIGNTTGTYNNYITPAKINKAHDYFTSCLPWTQKGDAVTLPLGTSADVYTDATTLADVSVYGTTPAAFHTLKADVANLQLDSTTGNENNKLYADLSNATSSTVNALRQSFQIQKFLERDARGGTRYTEKVYSHFGVKSPDARLQRPELLGLSQSVIQIHPVPQQGETGTTPQGNMAGFGTVSDQPAFTQSFTEHGYIIGVCAAVGDITYQQGINRHWSRSTQYDYYFPSFAYLGEQAVLNKEIYLQASAADDNTFGYQERFAEYRYKPSEIRGVFRSTAASSLDSWHLSEEFTTLPTLGDTFIQSNTPMDRAIAVTTEPHLIMDAYFDYQCTRPMPAYAPPGLIDHF